MEYVFTREESPATLRDVESGEVVAKIEFRDTTDGPIELDYLWVDSSRRGEGLARRMLDAFVASARDDESRIKPNCGVARGMMSGDERYKDVL